MQGKLLYDKGKRKQNFNIKATLKFLAGTDCYKQLTIACRAVEQYITDLVIQNEL